MFIRLLCVSFLTGLLLNHSQPFYDRQEAGEGILCVRTYTAFQEFLHFRGNRHSAIPEIPFCFFPDISAGFPCSFSGIHLEHRQCPCIEIHPDFCRSTFRLFLRAVLQSASGRKRRIPVINPASCLRQTEISDLGIPVFGQKQIPILGINTGRLGFLADILPEEMDVTIDEIYANHYKIEERAVLQLTTSNPLSVHPFALNEVAILKHDSSSMISIKAYINHEHLNTYQADGLIVATPTGSTGYSLSVGGPVIAPQSKTMVITPVAPHSLNCRPLVVRDDWEITLEVESRSHNFLVSVDGRSESCNEQTRLRITRAPYSVKLVKRFDHLYFNTLRSKMMWGADAR